LGADERDTDFHRVAAFVTNATHEPTLGEFRRFLEVAIHSQRRRQTSKLLAAFFALSRDWVESHWILQTTGLSNALNELTKNFRNPAAHIDELSQENYKACRDFVIGNDGMLWKIVLATQNQKEVRRNLVMQRQAI
jgi:hypothetical protein